MKKYILAHDLGTSGDKAALFSIEGILLGSRTIAYGTHYFQECCAEQNPEDWWKAVCVSTQELLNGLKIHKDEIVAVSFSGQMMGCVCVDCNGEALRPAMIWADHRSKKEAYHLGEKIPLKKFYQMTGHRNTASYGIQKLMWIKENEPEIYDQTYKVLNAKDYIVLKLTGKFYTDYSDADSMGCLDLKNRCWSEEIINTAGVSMEKMPEIKDSTFIAGNITDYAVKATGLAKETLVILGAGDGVAANVGAGSVKPGTAFGCLGTSAWIAATSEEPILDEEMRIVCWAHAVPGLYSPNGTMQYAGGSYNWLKNTICLSENEIARQKGISPYEIMDRTASRSPTGANGVIFLPYLIGERAPRWNEEAKGAFLGLKEESGRADIIRSVLEGVVMNLSVCLDVLCRKIPVEEVTIIGGGAKSVLWRQIMADVFQKRICIPSCLEEANSMGAAVIAGVGAGIYPGFDAIGKFQHIESVIEPEPNTLDIYHTRKEVFNLSYQALEKLFPYM